MINLEPFIKILIALIFFIIGYWQYTQQKINKLTDERIRLLHEEIEIRCKK